MVQRENLPSGEKHRVSDRMVAGRSLLMAVNGAAAAGSLGCVCEREREEKREIEKRGGRKGSTMV
jgi:hypothetical protein